MKKDIIIARLKLENTPISLTNLLEKLGPDFTERSVRRWLKDLSIEGLVLQIGKKRSTKYLIANSTATASDTNSIFSKESENTIAKVKRPLFERSPTSYNKEWLETYIPNKTFYIPEEVRFRLLSAGKRTDIIEPAGTYAHQIFNRFLIDLSYNSSRLEGNTYSLLETEKLLIEGKEVEGKLSEEKIMILNHKEAIRYLVDAAAKLKLSEKVIKTLHFLLSDGLLEPLESGEIRKHSVKISGSVYFPLENSVALDRQLKTIVSKALQIKDPYEQSFFLLLHISYLQAFADVNKRTARLAANIPLVINNLVPLSFNDIDKDNYISALIAVYELQEVKPFLDLYVYSYLRSSITYDVTLKAINFDVIRVRYRDLRRKLLREIIEKKIFGKKIQNLINSFADQVSSNERQGFIKNVKEDLQFIDETRIAGLGITAKQLKEWLKLRDKH